MEEEPDGFIDQILLNKDFFFFNTIHITVKCLILAELQGERLKLEGGGMEGPKQGVGAKCFSLKPSEQEPAI